MFEEIALRRLGKLVVPERDATATADRVATFGIEAAALGYVFDRELQDRLLACSASQLAHVSKNAIAAMARLKGYKDNFVPFHPGFPDEVASAHDIDLYLNALIHYWTDGKWRPPSLGPRRQSKKLSDAPPITIGLATHQEFIGILTTLVASKSPLSAADVADVEWFIAAQREHVVGALPDEIPIKETAALVAARLLQTDAAAGERFVADHLATATDVLRLCVALSHGDISLATPTKFVSLPRSVRKLALARIDAAPRAVEDMQRRPEVWKRLGERLHPGEHAARYPAAAAAFRAVRQGQPNTSFNAQADRALRSSGTDAVIALLATRPGEFARRLDLLVRRSDDPAAVIDAFRSVAPRASTAVLLQCEAHFGGYASRASGALRVFVPKGQTAKMWAALDTREPLAADVALRLRDACHDGLRQRFADRSPLGATYVDPRLADYAVPLGMRAAAKSLRTLGRGSRVALPDANCIRLFLWWKNGRERTDIDLSATIFDEHFKYVDVLSYYSLKNWGGVHSGDIVDAPSGAAEFIDLDIGRLVGRGVRYAVASLHSFTNQPYCDLPECFAGWMARSHPGSDEVFEPRTVIDRVDLASDTRISLPFIFDLVDRKMIWADLSLRRHPSVSTNVAGNLKGMSMMLRAMVSLVRPNMHTLATLHAQSRGRLTDNRDEATTVFAIDGGFTPFDVDRIRADLL